MSPVAEEAPAAEPVTTPDAATAVESTAVESQPSEPAADNVDPDGGYIGVKLHDPWIDTFESNLPALHCVTKAFLP